MTLCYDKITSPKSEKYYDSNYTKKEIIDLYRELIGMNNHIVRSRRSLKGVITRINKSG